MLCTIEMLFPISLATEFDVNIGLTLFAVGIAVGGELNTVAVTSLEYDQRLNAV